MREKRWLLCFLVAMCCSIMLRHTAMRVTAKRQNGNIESEWSLN